MIRVLILVMLALILFYIGSHRQVSGIRMTFLTAFFACGALLVLRPDAANSIAGLFGVGRGADLLLYFSVLLGVYVSAAFYFRLRHYENALISIVRELALSRPDHEEIAEQGEDPVKPQSSNLL